MKPDLCPAMRRPCATPPGTVECQMCFMTRVTSELQKIKDELKLINVRLFTKESEK